jgi:hypothetical protein
MDNIISKPLSKLVLEELLKKSKRSSNLIGKNTIIPEARRGPINFNDYTMIDYAAMTQQPQN